MASTLPFLFLLLFSTVFSMSSKPSPSTPRLSLKLLPMVGDDNYLRPKAISNGYLHNKEKDITVVSQVSPFPGVSAFLVNISIGDPSLWQLFLMDTGSDLTWLQCLPCKCYPQIIPFYSPSKSSTYRNSSCKSAPNAMPRVNYDQNAGICRYFLQYMDRTSTGGVLGKEKLTFQTSDDGLAFVHDVVFGCGHENVDKYNLYSGVLGLGPGTFSIMKHFGSRFSYCFGSLTDLNYSHNVLILGDNAIIQGDPTPFEILDDRYHVNLETISVGSKRLDVGPVNFQRTGYGTGTSIDTGCSVTILERLAYENLVQEVNLLFEDVMDRAEGYDIYKKPCFKGNIEYDLVGFPVVTFHFEGGAELALDVKSLFVSNGSEEFCLAVSMNMYDDRSVIGVTAQQNYNVGFDLEAMRVYFQRIDCELLAE